MYFTATDLKEVVFTVTNLSGKGKTLHTRGWVYFGKQMICQFINVFGRPRTSWKFVGYKFSAVQNFS